MISKYIRYCKDTGFDFSALTFPTILDDPMIRTVMKADHVDSRELETDLARIAATIDARGQPAIAAPEVKWRAGSCD
jgi:hypothetical protein